MNKNILIISASPRKGGNSDVLCDEFMRGAIESGNNAEKIRISEKKIGYCVGCGVCHEAHKCFQNDDMAEILDKMVKADVIVLATPVYFYTMDAQLKTLIDRTVPRYTEISDKDFYFIATAADADPDMLERTISGLRGFTDDCLTHPNEKGVLLAAGVWEKGAVNSTNYMKQAYEMGKNA